MTLLTIHMFDLNVILRCCSILEGSDTPILCTVVGIRFSYACYVKLRPGVPAIDDLVVGTWRPGKRLLYC